MAWTLYEIDRRNNSSDSKSVNRRPVAQFGHGSFPSEEGKILDRHGVQKVVSTADKTMVLVRRNGIISKLLYQVGVETGKLVELTAENGSKNSTLELPGGDFAIGHRKLK